MINFPKGVKPSKCETASRTVLTPSPHGMIRTVVRVPSSKKHDGDKTK